MQSRCVYAFVSDTLFNVMYVGFIHVIVYNGSLFLLWYNSLSINVPQYIYIFIVDGILSLLIFGSYK